MKSYKEWQHLRQEHDEKNPFSSLYFYNNGDSFYIEPVYYAYLQNAALQYPNTINAILDEMERIVHHYHHVIFSGLDEETEEEPATKKQGYLYRTIHDVLGNLQIFVDNKSRGSDYGD